jgi:hypothetical protein
LRITITAPFDQDHHIQCAAIPDKRLGDWWPPELHAGIAGVLANGVFLDEWQTYQPTDRDRLQILVKTDALFTAIGVGGATIWGALASIAITTVVSSAISIGLSYLIKALTPAPTPPRTEGRPEQVFGIAGTVLAGAYADVVVHEGALIALPQGMAPLLKQVLGLPFRLGSQDPAQGGLDCAGLIKWMFAQRVLQSTEPSTLDMRRLDPVWTASAPGARADGWRRLMQPWDILISQDPGAQAALHAQAETPVDTWLHTSLAISPEWVVMAPMDQGTTLLSAAFLQERFGETIIALLRPPALHGAGGQNLPQTATPSRRMAHAPLP